MNRNAENLIISWLSITLFNFLLVSNVYSEKFLFRENINSTLIPITVTIRSINDLRAKQGQEVKTEQVTCLKAKLERVRQTVKEENLPEVVINHETTLMGS